MKTTLLFISMLAGCFAFAQPGTLDTTFGISGYSMLSLGAEGDDIQKILIQPDNKILSVGTSYIAPNTSAIALTRHNADGTLDISFNSTVTPAGTGSSTHGKDIALQSDGKILITGYCFNTDSHYDMLLMRFNSNGLLDSSFGTGGKVMLDVGNIGGSDYMYAITVLPDGKIIAVGQAQTLEQSSIPVAVKFNANGTLDTSFGTNGILWIDFAPFYNFPVAAWMPFASNVIILQDGNILVSGRAGEGYSDLAFAKLNANGNFDASFGTDGKAIFSGPVFHDKNLIEQPDGKILIMAKGTIAPDQGAVLYHVIVRLNSNGSPDIAFGTNGKLFIAPSQTPYCGAIALEQNGKILAIDNPDPFVNDNLLMTRFKADGTLDTTFGINGSYSQDFPQLNYYIPQDLKILADGKILAGVSINLDSNADMGLMRFNGGETAGINEKAMDIFSIYPNPTTNILNISNPENIILDGIDIIDITGKTVLQQTDNLSQIDVQNLSPGMYFLQLTSGEKEYRHKFIKQ